MNVYELSRNFWDWAFENPDKIKPNHSAMYFFAIEHCNRLGWKEKFGFPTAMAMEAIGIKSYNTFINTLKELVDFGFIQMVEKSKNQYSANIIALSNFNEAHNEALDKALIKHTTKQSESTIQSTSESIYSIDKQIYNNTNLPIYNLEAVASEQIEKSFSEIPIELTSEQKYDGVNPDSSKRKKVAPKKEKYFNKDDFKKKLLDLGVEEKHANDWIQIRKDKRASFTESAIDGIIRECEKHNFPFPEAIRNCAESNWQGFKYEWIKNKNQNGQFNGNNQSANNEFSNYGNAFSKINGRSSPFTVEDFITTS